MPKFSAKKATTTNNTFCRMMSKSRNWGQARVGWKRLTRWAYGTLTIAPKLSVDDGIQAARTLIARCWFDEENCGRGIEALRQYRREFDEKMKTWRGRPLHDWTSHGADAFRYLAVGYRSQSDWGEPIRRNLRGIA
jgi:phage terminase large subunit